MTNLIERVKKRIDDEETQTRWPRNHHEIEFLNSIVDALEQMQADRDKWVKLWEKASNSVLTLQGRIEELEAELKATQENEERLAEANKPLLARACKAEADNERLRGFISRINDWYNGHELADGELEKLLAVQESHDERTD